MDFLPWSRGSYPGSRIPGLCRLQPVDRGPPVRTGCAMRLFAALLLLLVAVPAAHPAAPPARGRDGRVFPLAGGGREDPREGLPATRRHFFGTLDVAAW